MTAPPRQAPAFRPAQNTITDHDTHCVPLGYDRRALTPGQPLPLPAPRLLLERMRACVRVELAFHQKLGDSLLALTTARATLDWMAQNQKLWSPTVQASGPYTALLLRAGLLTATEPAHATGPLLVIGDRRGVAARSFDAAFALVCAPEAPPCWASDGLTYAALPDRYYLALERRLGVRLPSEPPFALQLTARPNELVHRLHAAGWFSGITVAAITATSWPDLKDYTAQRFFEVTRHLARRLAAPIRLLLVGGQSAGSVRITAEDVHTDTPALRIDGLPAHELADLFPHCSLVIGNDTGLTHLAALARRDDGKGPPVVGLYARHSHGKWNTGLPHHHAVATEFSQQMHQGDLCPVRDALVPAVNDRGLAAVAPAWLAGIAADLISGRPV